MTCRGIQSGRASSTRRRLSTPSGASSSASWRGPSRSPRAKAGAIPTTTPLWPRPSRRPKTPTCPRQHRSGHQEGHRRRRRRRDLSCTSPTRATGPNGVAVYVTALTDNKNRTAADVRYIFDRSGRQARHRRLGQLDVRAQGRHLRRRRRQGRGRDHDGRHRGGRRGRDPRRRRVRDPLRPGRLHGRARGPGGGRHQVLVGRAHHDPQEHRGSRREPTPARPSGSWTPSKTTTTSKRSTPTSTSPTKSWRPWPGESGARPHERAGRPGDPGPRPGDGLHGFGVISVVGNRLQAAGLRGHGDARRACLSRSGWS